MSIIDPTRAVTIELALETRKRNKIANSQSFDMGNLLPLTVAMLNEYAKKTGAVQRTHTPSLIYNCHGLTFAARRTSIDDDADVHRILFEDDGYEELDVRNVTPGDVAVYFGPRQTVPHTALVVSYPKQEELWVPLVVSKFGHFTEWIHRANAVPQGLEYDELKYFRVTS